MKEVFVNEQLVVTDKAIIPIAAFTAKGDVKNLHASLVNGLQAGLSVNQIKEILVQM